jgi:L-asparagine transporter-like permease
LKLMNASERNPRKFSTTYLSIMSVRLLVYLVFILVCLLIERTNAVNFVVTFLVLYLAFTIFEVIEISNFLKKNPNSSN